ncbi:hypothetical protein J6590_009087 [Homalodisca vitripennis]|nr:hypothetical protein J6590_009087 [Homalodisca vitripennis]
MSVPLVWEHAAFTLLVSEDHTACINMPPTVRQAHNICWSLSRRYGGNRYPLGKSLKELSQTFLESQFLEDFGMCNFQAYGILVTWNSRSLGVPGLWMLPVPARARSIRTLGNGNIQCRHNLWLPFG